MPGGIWVRLKSFVKGWVLPLEVFFLVKRFYLSNQGEVSQPSSTEEEEDARTSCPPGARD